MSKEAFARNLTRLVEAARWSRQELAVKVGLDEKTLWRWMQNGVGRVSGKNKESLHSLCRLLGVPPDALWEGRMEQADICAEKVREMVGIWERVGINFDWIETYHCAAVAVDRLRREEPEFWNRLRRLRGAGSDAQLHRQIEKEMRDRIDAERLGQVEAFRRLVELAKESQG